MSYYYQAFGIPIVSEIELPALLMSEGVSDIAAVYVKEGQVPDSLKEPPTEIKPFTTFNEKEFRYEIQNIGKYYVTEGQEIIMEPLSENKEEFLLYFYSNCLAAILFQRNQLPFHVSGVFIEEQKVVLFAAPSRTGKSTTALMLQQRGYAPFTDDTAVLSIVDNKCFAQASYPMMRLWQNTINQQEMLEESDKKTLWSNTEMDKYGFHFHDLFVTGSVEVAAIVFLEEEGLSLKIEELNPAIGMSKLFGNIYRGQWIKEMKKGKLQFELITKICQKVPTFQATRPKGVSTFESFAELIENEIIFSFQSAYKTK